MPEMRDVIVIGGGPAGSTTAKYAAKNGADVLLLERKATVGAPIQCGELLAEVEEMRSVYRGDHDFAEFADIPEWVKKHHTTAIRIHGPGVGPFEFPFRAYTLDRPEFDPILLAQAEQAGAEVRLQANVTRVGGNEVMTKTGEVYRARVIIGADGPRSRVGKQLGFARNSALAPAYTTQVTGDFGDICEMWFGDLAPGGYAWMFPKGKQANVGLGIQTRKRGIKATDLLRAFCTKRGWEAGDITGGLIPVGGPIPRTQRANHLLVGDAAGQVMATNGGGIPIALTCGRIAGEVAATHVREGTDLVEYEKRWRALLGKPLKTAARIKRLGDLAGGNDWLLRVMMKVAGPRGLENIMRCRPVFWMI